MRSLAGIERLTRLRRLDLRGTGITDLGRLAGREPMPRVLVDRRSRRRKPEPRPGADGQKGIVV